MSLDGMPTNARVVARVGQNELTIDQYGPQVGPPAMRSVQWSVEAEPCPHGDTAIIDILDVPLAVADQAEAFEVSVNGNVTLLPMGTRTHVKRHVKIARNAVSEVCLRVVWRQLEDRVTETRSEWSAPNFVTAHQDEQAMTATIIPDETSIVAGEGVTFRAEATGFGALDETRDLHFRWDYGDPGSQHQRMDQAFETVHGIDANISYDKLGAHVYRAPGVYTVTVTVTDREGRQGTDQIQITVEDANQHFDVANDGLTVLIDPVNGSPSFDGVVLSSGLDDPNLNGLRVFQKASSASYFAQGTYSRLRILFKRGEQHSQVHLKRPGIAKFHLGAYGTGPDPVIDDSDLAFSGRLAQFGTQANVVHETAAVTDLVFEGGYDPANPGVRPADGVEFYALPKLTVHNCEIRGIDRGIVVGGGGSILLASTRITNWSNYGISMTGTAPDGQGRHFFVGCTLTQNPNTLRNEGKNSNENPFYADHGPYRVSRPFEDVAFIQCRLFSSNSWADGSTVQLVNRVNAFGEAGHRHIMSQCLTEGSSLYLGPTAGFDGAAAVDYKISKCLHICAAGGFSGTGFSGIVFENNIVIFGDQSVERQPTSHFSANETHNPDSLSSDDSFNVFSRNRPNKGCAYLQPITFRNNTIIDLRAGEGQNWQGSYHVNDFQDVRIANNIVHAPNISGAAAVPNLDLAQQFDPLYLGRRFLGENGDAMQTQFGNDGQGLVPVPLTGCEAIGAATGPERALDDFSGQLRMDRLAGLSRTTASTGAIEPLLES